MALISSVSLSIFHFPILFIYLLFEKNPYLFAYWTDQNKLPKTVYQKNRQTLVWICWGIGNQRERKIENVLANLRWRALDVPNRRHRKPPPRRRYPRPRRQRLGSERIFPSGLISSFFHFSRSKSFRFCSLGFGSFWVWIPLSIDVWWNWSISIMSIRLWNWRFWIHRSVVIWTFEFLIGAFSISLTWLWIVLSLIGCVLISPISDV